jgi:cellulose synthase/poly-beta-1,6-N-acetylglucosamine synthase-like glycosyltransferase
MILVIKIFLAVNIIYFFFDIIVTIAAVRKKIKLMTKDSFKSVNEPITTIIPLKNCTRNEFENILHLLDNLPNSRSKIIVALESSYENYANQLEELSANNEQIKILYSGIPAGIISPKTFNMNEAFKIAEDEFIVFKDADVIASRENYSDLFYHLKEEKFGGGFAPAFYFKGNSSGGNLISIVTNYYFNANLLKWNEVINFNFCAGAFMMFKRSALLNAGGLISIIKNISDDASLGRILTDAGYKIAYSHKPVYMNAEQLSFFPALNHIKKWLIIIRKVTGLSYYFIPFTFYIGNIIAAVVMLSIFNEFSIIYIFILILMMLNKIYFSAKLDRAVFKKNFSLLHYLKVFFLGIPQPFVWLSSLFFHQLEWRGRKYKIGKGGIIMSPEITE